jgi:predicted alpha/beta hydrolase
MLAPAQSGREVAIPAADGRLLAATLFEPPSPAGGQGAPTVIAGGTGIGRRYYARFAADAGYSFFFQPRALRQRSQAARAAAYAACLASYDDPSVSRAALCLRTAAFWQSSTSTTASSRLIFLLGWV